MTTNKYKQYTEAVRQAIENYDGVITNRKELEASGILDNIVAEERVVYFCTKINELQELNLEPDLSKNKYGIVNFYIGCVGTIVDFDIDIDDTSFEMLSAGIESVLNVDEPNLLEELAELLKSMR